jgi:hypothetical protein
MGGTQSFSKELTVDEQLILAGYRLLDAESQGRLKAFVQSLPKAFSKPAKPEQADTSMKPNPEAKASLLRRLRAIGTEKFDAMSQDEYGDWIDSLPFEEFLELVVLGNQAD